MLIGKGVNLSLNVWQNSSVKQFESGDFCGQEFLHYEHNFSSSYRAIPCNYPFHIDAAVVCIMPAAVGLFLSLVTILLLGLDTMAKAV